MPININIKGSNEARFNISIELSETVLDLKKKIETAATSDPTPPESQLLIYSGRIMKDEDPLSTYKLADGHT